MEFYGVDFYGVGSSGGLSGEAYQLPDVLPELYVNAAKQRNGK